MTSEAEFPWDMPGEREEASIRIVLDHPVNPWEHEGAGSIWWGANLDRLAPLAEKAVSIIREAWERRGESIHDRARREQEESEPVEREPVAGPSITPGWAARIEPNQYWIRLNLYRPVNPRWEEQEGENWARGQLVNDGILERGVTVEATTHLGPAGAADHRGAARSSSVRRARAPGAQCLALVGRVLLGPKPNVSA
ncbi:MAG TPA: hypothetical protein VEF89_19915 [Solirubrobacteraceae bacterium]|nr:hypothetical protein [Solirubrobacteraceae bacterium]